jgi:signal transduction histidine kinase
MDEAQPDSERDLLSSVCHDLKEPLASITMGVGFLRRLLSEQDAGALRVVEAIQRAAARMDQRVSTFSDLARLEAHELTLQIEQHEVGPILGATKEQFLTDAATRQLAVSLEIPANVATLWLPCDRSRLSQILRCLWACVLRVAPDGAIVSIGARTDAAGAVRFEVAARRSAGSRDFTAPLPKPELAIARGLVDLHGGQLAVAREEGSLSLSFTLQGATPSDTARVVGSKP